MGGRSPIARRVAARELARKGPKYRTSFYGYDDGTWEAVNGFILGFRKAGYDWEVVPSMSRQNDWRTFSVEGATEQHSGFRRALKEIARQYPEVLDFIIQFDGPYKEVRQLVGGSSPGPKIRWETITFYHGTSAKAWEAIQREGMKPRGVTNVNPAYGVGSSAGEGRSDAIYLTTQATMAHFAALDAAKTQGSSPVVLQIKGLDGDAMAADEDSGETDAVKSLGRLGSVAYVGAIPANKIRLYERFDDRRWERVARRVAARWARANPVWGRDHFLVKEPGGYLSIMAIEGEVPCLKGIIGLALASGCGPDVVAVEYAEAAQGYGPVLYDAAMEYVYPKGLTPAQKTGTSPQALAVWDFYLNSRSDIDKRPKPDTARCKLKGQEALDHIYFKKPAAAARALMTVEQFNKHPVVIREFGESPNVQRPHIEAPECAMMGRQAGLVLQGRRDRLGLETVVDRDGVRGDLA